MKKILFCLAVIGSSVLFSSCEPKCGQDRDMSLAGSISSSFVYYSFTATGEYDGTSLGEYRNDYDISFTKQSDTNVSMGYGGIFGEEETAVGIYIPSIPLHGDPDNVTFDYVSDHATVVYNDVEYSSIRTSIKGWVRNENFKPEATRCSPAVQEFLCEIDIECLLDGKKLKIDINPL